MIVILLSLLYKKNATKLIIGTIPPPRFCLPKPNLSENDVNFYYGSEDNHFWRLIGKIFKIDFVKENTPKAIKQREDFLEKHNWGLHFTQPHPTGGVLMILAYGVALT